LHNVFAVLQPKHSFRFTLQVEEVLSGVLLPGMMLTPAVPAVASEIYFVLAALPYTTRYRLYTQLRVRGLPEKGKIASPSPVGTCRCAGGRNHVSQSHKHLLYGPASSAAAL